MVNTKQLIKSKSYRFVVSDTNRERVPWSLVDDVKQLMGRGGKS